jgi:MoaA/NifB/PqqE/SkfB family radical SAM enzyme
MLTLDCLEVPMTCATSQYPKAMTQRLWLYVTFDCNLSCRYCVTASDPPARRPSLIEQEFRTLVDDAVRARFRHLAVSGGEPFLHPDILPMLEYATLRIRTVVLTNATLLATPRLSGLRRLNRRNLTVQVSLDSGDPRIHDSYRGEGCWKRTVQGLKLLQELGFDITVRSTVTEQTETDWEELHRFLEGMGISRNRCYAVPVVRGGRARDGIEHKLADLMPEPTVTGDGLYWHPLKVDTSLRIAPDPMPLEPALLRMAELVREVKPPCASRGYR